MLVVAWIKSIVKKTNDNSKVEPTLESLNENFALNNEDISHCTSFKTMMRFQ